MHPIRILAELRIKGVTVSEVAEKCGVSRTAVYHTLHRRPFPSPKVEREIARILEVPVDELWPDRAAVAA